MDHPVLTGEQVTLRALTEDDLPALLDMLLQPGVAEWWPGYDMARLRVDALDTPETTSLAVEADGAFVGLVMYTEEQDPYYKHASIDITLDARLLGRGLGTDTLRTVIRYLFEGRGHHRITIDPALANVRAIAAYKKVGFKPIGAVREYEKGADGTFHDNLLMEMLAGELQ
ncbi:MAG: GNAT family N-acetyltransferase [Coriobacteriia bacterium]|nr:GNAT family N-acetyltransferase [Coriobacteriia bacterium]